MNNEAFEWSLGLFLFACVCVISAMRTRRRLLNAIAVQKLPNDKISMRTILPFAINEGQLEGGWHRPQQARNNSYNNIVQCTRRWCQRLGCASLPELCGCPLRSECDNEAWNKRWSRNEQYANARKKDPNWIIISLAFVLRQFGSRVQVVVSFSGQHICRHNVIPNAQRGTHGLRFNI